VRKISLFLSVVLIAFAGGVIWIHNHQSNIIEEINNQWNLNLLNTEKVQCLMNTSGGFGGGEEKIIKLTYLENEKINLPLMIEINRENYNILIDSQCLDLGKDKAEYKAILEEMLKEDKIYFYQVSSKENELTCIDIFYKEQTNEVYLFTYTD